MPTDDVPCDLLRRNDGKEHFSSFFLSFRSTLALSEERLSNLATVKILTYFDCVVTVCGGYMRSIT